MPDEIRLLAGLVSALAALLLTPLAIKLARRFGLLDDPVGYKGHAAPTPYLGGAAVLAACAAGALPLAGDLDRMAAIFGGAAALCVVGTIDDRRNLPPQYRVLVEALVACVLWASGLHWTLFASEWANLGLTVAWFVAVINAFNLMDNLDGAAASVAAVTGLIVAAIALQGGGVGIATLAICLSCACAAFLYYNLAGPARIFLGDGGSMPIGYLLATCVMVTAEGTNRGWVGGVGAVLLVGLPILDTALVIVSRRRRGARVFTGARDHVTHRLRARLGSERSVAAVVALVHGLLGACAFAVVELDIERAAVVVGIVSVCLATGVGVVHRSRGPVLRRPAADGTHR